MSLSISSARYGIDWASNGWMKDPLLHDKGFERHVFVYEGAQDV